MLQQTYLLFFKIKKDSSIELSFCQAQIQWKHQLRPSIWFKLYFNIFWGEEEEVDM